MKRTARSASLFTAALLLMLLPAAGAMAARPEQNDSAPITPKEKIALFNGEDLGSLYVHMQDTGYEDPRKVFTVHDGLLHVSGDGFGYVATKDNYRDYHLVTEWRWGENTYGKRKERTKDTGVLVHARGPDGNAGAWMHSIEANVIQGGVGDFILVAGKAADGTPLPISLTCEVGKDRDGEYIWQAGGERVTFNNDFRKRINWFDRDPDWVDEIGFRGKREVESPDGEWNRLEVVCDGGYIGVYLNGVKVNEGFNAVPDSGKLYFQTEGAEVFFRRIDLYPLGALEPAGQAAEKN